MHGMTWLLIQLYGLGDIVLIKYILKLSARTCINSPHKLLTLLRFYSLQLFHRTFEKIVAFIIGQVPIFVFYDELI